jgi:hypothetical protein
MTRLGGAHVILAGASAGGVRLACRLRESIPVESPRSHSSFAVLTRGSIHVARWIARSVGDIAYATTGPDHTLNVRAADMRAFADDPDRFWRWFSTGRPATAGSPGARARAVALR